MPESAHLIWDRGKEELIKKVLKQNHWIQLNSSLKFHQPRKHFLQLMSFMSPSTSPSFFYSWHTPHHLSLSPPLCNSQVQNPNIQARIKKTWALCFPHFTLELLCSTFSFLFLSLDSAKPNSNSPFHTSLFLKSFHFTYKSWNQYEVCCTQKLSLLG